MEGTATRVQRDQEGAATVLRFVLAGDDGAVAAVEMRGAEFRGSLADGDRIWLNSDAVAASADGLRRPATVENLTTGITVTAWSPPLLRRLLNPVGTALLGAVVSAVVTLIFSSVFESSGNAGVAPADDGSGVIVTLVVAVCVWVAWSAVRRRRGRPILPITIGLAAGWLLTIVAILPA